MNDWLLALVAAAHEHRPRSAGLREITEELGLTATGPRLLNVTTRRSKKSSRHRGNSSMEAISARMAGCDPRTVALRIQIRRWVG